MKQSGKTTPAQVTYTTSGRRVETPGDPVSRWILLRVHPQHGKIPCRFSDATAAFYKSQAVAYDHAMDIEESHTGREFNAVLRTDVRACLIYGDGTIEVPDLELRWTAEQFLALY